MSQKNSSLRYAFYGALVAVLGAFPCSMLVGFVIGFPVPFGAKAYFFDAISTRVLLAVLFFQLMGGFIALTLFGAMAGFASYSYEKTDEKIKMCIIFSLSVSMIFALFLSILDLFIGQW